MRAQALRIAYLAVALPFSTAAQRITITPQLGVYVPLKHQGSVGGDCDVRAQCSPPGRLKVNEGPAVSVKVAIDWTPDVALEVSLAATASDQLTTFAPVLPDTGPGSVFKDPVVNTFGSLRVTRVWHVSARTDVGVGVGATLANLSGGSAGLLRKRTILGPTAGATLRVALSDRTRFDLSLYDAMYTIVYNRYIASGTRDSFVQHDLMFAAGFGFAV